MPSFSAPGLAHAQQELAQPVTRSQLILLGFLACPHQIPQRVERGKRQDDEVIKPLKTKAFYSPWIGPYASPSPN